MDTNECSQPASKSSWDSQDFGDVSMVLKMVHFRKSTRPQWVKVHLLLGFMVYGHCFGHNILKQMLEFLIEFNHSMLVRGLLYITSVWFRLWLGAAKHQANNRKNVEQALGIWHHPGPTNQGEHIN